MNVLLSIKPKYAEAILNGSKRYEFRKSIFNRRDEIDLVYMYATAPVKKIVGAFTIKKITKGHPKALWKALKGVSGLTKEEFFMYFGATQKGIAIEIGKIHRCEEPVDPKELIPEFVPPQSFCYIDGQLDELKSFTLR